MMLKFIGADGSMGLCHGAYYNVIIKNSNRYIWVVMPKFEKRRIIFTKWRCPYSSPQTFADNWSI